MRKPANLILRRREPLCAETAPDRLVERFLTAEPDFFIRNHGPVPRLAPDHAIAIEGLVERPATYTIADLRVQFTQRTVTATVQCAGNRRAHLQGVAPTSGDPWDVGAIGTARWTGVALADVLAAAGIEAGARHVAFAATDLAEGGGTVARYEVSIPLATALADHVLLAWAMNDSPLTPEHGFPLRTIVPGCAGVRSVKWLERITLSADESAAPMHARDYRQFAPAVTADAADWAGAPAIQNLPLNSAICVPGEGANVAAGPVTVRGWAMSGRATVARVEVSGDGGQTWRGAALERGPDADSWVLWSAAIELPPGGHELVVRAFDANGAGQPADPADIWNFKGYLSAAWHRIGVTAG